jgi:hypothetical protein
MRESADQEKPNSGLVGFFLNLFAHVFNVFARSMSGTATTGGGEGRHHGDEQNDYQTRHDVFHNRIGLVCFGNDFHSATDASDRTTPGEEGDEKEHQKHHEQDFRDGGSQTGNAEETQDAGD